MRQNPLIQFAVFLAVGAASFGTYFAAFRLATLALDLSDWLALSLAYAAGVLVHFVLNRSVTFARGGPLRSALLGKYLALVVVNYFIAMTVTLIALQTGAPDWAALIGGTVVTTGISFLISRYWVFV